MLLSFKLFLKSKSPGWKGFWFKLLFGSKRLKIGNGFKCDTWPDILLTQKGSVEIGDNVYLRRNVEIRAHQNAKILLEGNNRIDRGVRVLASNDSQLTIGKGTRVGLYSIFNGGDSITVGKNVLISGFVYLQTSMHRHEAGTNVQNQGFHHAPVVIEDDCWCGAHVVVLPGVTLKKGAIVGSNAVVNSNVTENEIVGGVPAKTIKTRV